MAATLKWMFVLVLLIAVAGGGTAYWFYMRSDEGLRQAVLKQLRTMAPDLKFDVASTQFDLSGRVRIYGLTVALPDDEPDQPSLEVPELIVTLESPAMTEFEMVIQRLFVVKPKLRVVRNEDNQWNWQQAVFQSPGSASLPDIEIENGSVLVEFQLPEDSARRFDFQNFNVTAHPSDSKRFLAQVATQLKQTGPLMLEVDARLDGSYWKCETRDAWRVPINQGLVQLLCDLSPEVAAQAAKAGQWIENAKALQAATGGTSTKLSRDSFRQFPTSAVGPVAPDFGMRCMCDFSFRLQKDAPDSMLRYMFQADVSRGEIDNQLLPCPIHDLSGRFYADNQTIEVSNVHGSNGPTEVSFKGRVVPNEPIGATMQIRGVELNDAVKSRLPESLRRTIQNLGITGLCDLDAKVIQDGDAWERQIDLRLKKATVTAKWFPVTVRDVEGELHLARGVVKFDALGKYAGQPVKAYGTITNPGARQQADFVIRSNNLPIDDESLAACPPQVMKAIEALRLKGRYDFLLRINRLAGENSKYEPELNIKVFDAALSFTGFPFDIKQLHGFVRWKGDEVEFSELVGMHDRARITGSGSYQLLPKPGRLNLTIDAIDASFDRSLENAVPRTLRTVWNQFQPQGQFDMKAKIGWTPGEPCEIVLPRVRVRDGMVLMTCFPWPLHNLSGEFSYNTEPGKLVMKELYAEHDDAEFRASGTGLFPTGKPWRLDFTEFVVDNLIPSGTLRNALPGGMQKVFDSLRPEGAYSFAGPVHFSSPKSGDNTVAAAWDLKLVLSRCSLTAGSRVEEINGEVLLKGDWDGSKATLDGTLDLDSLLVFRMQSGQAYQITKVRGPISLHDGILIAGTESAIPPRKSDKIDERRRIVGNVIDGTVYLDTVVDLEGEPAYKIFVELTEGRLETYAQQYLHGKSKLAGAMNGWINLHGRGSSADRLAGGGKLVIAPASLYELPLFAQIFRILQMQSADRTAFEQADVEFTVANSQFDFNSIELQGNSLNMKGRGFVRFDGAMQLDFGVKLRQMIPNPFMRGLVAVKVSGNVGDPKTIVVPFPQLDDAFRQFLGAFDSRWMAPRPAMFGPRTGQNLDDTRR